MSGIRLRGAGSCTPGRRVTNDDLAKRVDTSDEWISSRTGIRERRVRTNESHGQLCAQAAKQALERAGVSPADIGVCLVATMRADTVVPSAACLLQRELGLPHDTVCFDLNAACSGFVVALHTAECLLAAAPRKFALVVGCEILSAITDWDDRSTCVLFGDGAGAAVVEWRPEWESASAVLGAHSNEELLFCEQGGTLSMKGQPVFKFAVEAVPWCMDQVLDKRGMEATDVDLFLLHQANARIIDLVARKYGLPAEKCPKNIDRCGNTSAASIPLLLSQLEEEGRLSGGQKLMLVGFGGGLTWGGCLLEVERD